ncbi:hypothetical protein [Gymnodinialimonas hymeniacidonis]|uniref:hypothetical protein n=1 Tax=Gymnodinialimonas hymeniacidonis TaxID=3126508 RepID=UPI0034C69AA6
MSKTRFLGYWIVSHDEDSALEAVRMAGLPLLLMGFNLLGLAILFLSLVPTFGPAILGLLGTAIACIIIAFRLREGHAAWVPIVALLFGAYIIVNVAFTWLGATIAAAPSGALIATQWIIPLICLILVSAGIRGWLWLRSNGVKRSF